MSKLIEQVARKWSWPTWPESNLGNNDWHNRDLIAALRELSAKLEGAHTTQAGHDAKEEKMVGPKQCAICGFPLQASREFGCVKGDCSQRPFPDKFYDFDRAEREYKRKFDDSHRPAPAQATREQLASRVAALEQRIAFTGRLLSEAYGEFASMAGGESNDSRWMLEYQIFAEHGEIPKQGLSRGELRALLARLREVKG